MAFFKKLFGKKEESLPTNENIFIETAQLISNNDEMVVSETRHLIDHYDDYFKKNIENGHSDRGLTSATPKYTICLMAMIDILIQHGYMMEFDWKEDTDEIIEGIADIAEKLQLKFKPKIDLSALDEGENADDLEPERVFTLISGYIDQYCYNIVTIDINSDSYATCIFPHKILDKCKTTLADLDIKIISY